MHLACFEHLICKVCKQKLGQFENHAENLWHDEDLIKLYWLKYLVLPSKRFLWNKFTKIDPKKFVKTASIQCVVSNSPHFCSSFFICWNISIYALFSFIHFILIFFSKMTSICINISRGLIILAMRWCLLSSAHWGFHFHLESEHIKAKLIFLFCCHCHFFTTIDQISVFAVPLDTRWKKKNNTEKRKWRGWVKWGKCKMKRKCISHFRFMCVTHVEMYTVHTHMCVYGIYVNIHFIFRILRMGVETGDFALITHSIN